MPDISKWNINIQEISSDNSISSENNSKVSEDRIKINNDLSSLKGNNNIKLLINNSSDLSKMDTD